MVGGAWKDDFYVHGQQNERLWWNCCELEVEWRKWGWHPLFDIFTTIPSLWVLAPTFPWTHNNNEAITICDRIYNMERVGMFYPMPWCVRFLKFYTFSRGINIPLVHPLHGDIGRNCKPWFSKRFNNRQCQTILAMMQEEGPMLFVGGVGSLIEMGWQAQA